jgi:hypothetical protein
MYYGHTCNSNRVETNEAEAVLLQHLSDSYSILLFCQHGRWKDSIKMDILRNGVDWNQVRSTRRHGIDQCLKLRSLAQGILKKAIELTEESPNCPQYVKDNIKYQLLCIFYVR